MMSLVHLLSCPEEDHFTYWYKRRRGIDLAAARLLHCALSRNNSNIPLLQLLNLIWRNSTWKPGVSTVTLLWCTHYSIPHGQCFTRLCRRYPKPEPWLAPWISIGKDVYIFSRGLSACGNDGVDLKLKKQQSISLRPHITQHRWIYSFGCCSFSQSLVTLL